MKKHLLTAWLVQRASALDEQRCAGDRVATGHGGLGGLPLGRIGGCVLLDCG